MILATQNFSFPQGYMTKVAVTLESKVEIIKYKPTILKNVIFYVTFITKKCIIIFIYLCMYLFVCAGS